MLRPFRSICPTVDRSYVRYRLEFRDLGSGIGDPDARDPEAEDPDAAAATLSGSRIPDPGSRS